MKICVLIPAFNESKSIGPIIEALIKKGVPVLIVDDGSTDGTGRMAIDYGVNLIRHQKNMGKGASLKDGFDYIAGHDLYDAVIVMDADGQHSVEDIDKFLDIARKGSADIVVGNRMGHAENMPRVRYYTNKFLSFMLSGICRQVIPDTQCGYRLLTRKALKDIRLDSSNFETESEMLIVASRKGFKIMSVPIETVYRGEKSEINPVTDTIRFAKLIAKYTFDRHSK